MKTTTKYSYLLACVLVLLTGTIYAQNNQNKSDNASDVTDCYITEFPYTAYVDSLFRYSDCALYEELEGEFTVDSLINELYRRLTPVEGESSKARVILPKMKLSLINFPYFAFRYQVGITEISDRDSIFVQYRSNEDEQWNTIKSYGNNFVDTVYSDTVFLPNSSDTYQIAFLIESNGDNGNPITLGNFIVGNVGQVWPVEYYEVIPPTLRDMNVQTVGQTYALLTGGIRKGNQPIREKGFQWWITGEDSISSLALPDEFGAIIGNLHPGTDYTFRGYAKTLSGYSYSYEKTFRTLDNVGLESLESESEMKLYPNPTQDSFVLGVENLQSDARVMVVDQVGKIIGEYVLLQGKNELEIGLEGLPAGVYYVNIVGDKVSLCRKIVKQ